MANDRTWETCACAGITSQVLPVHKEDQASKHQALDTVSEAYIIASAMGKKNEESYFSLDALLDHPLLTAEEEIALIRAFAKANQVRDYLRKNGAPHNEEWQAILEEGEAAKDKLVKSNIRLVYHVVGHFGRYINHNLTLDDLIQEGMVGLLKAIHHFDPDRGIRFSTYAVWWIRQAVMRAIANKGGSVRLPVYLRERISRIQKASQTLMNKLGRMPSQEEIAAYCNMPADEVARALAYSEQAVSVIRLDGEDSDDDDDRSLHEVITTSDSDILDEVERSIAMSRVYEALEKLTQEEREVIEKWMEANGKRVSPSTIAETLCMSERMARAVLRSALRKLARAIG
ncbi:MAG: sigma-70 family RNA polymerase sigma factor [Candidatus Methanomethylicaceae archaeon]